MVLPMYKPSTRKNHRHIIAKHLLPRFGDTAVCDVTRQEIQAYVAHLSTRQATRPGRSTLFTRAERGASDRGYMGPPHRQPRPRRRTADAEDRQAKWALTINLEAALLKVLPPSRRRCAAWRC
ncbi:MAG: hypothetical protein ACRD3G_05170 [Vicinamibacterales bacterium]